MVSIGLLLSSFLDSTLKEAPVLEKGWQD